MIGASQKQVEAVMQRIFIQRLFVLLLAAGSWAIVPAEAQGNGQEFNQLLQGDYAFTQREACVATPRESFPPTFDPDTLELVGEAETITIQSQGVTTLDGMGGWTAQTRGVIVRNDRTQIGDTPVLPPIFAECEGTYSVNGDRSIEDFTGTCTTADGSIEFGPRTLSGHLSVDGKVLVLADTEPTLEKLTLTDLGFVVGERICSSIAMDARLIGSDS